MWRLDDADPGGALLIDNLVAQSLYSRPMDLRPKMMFGVVTVVKPDPVIQFVITAHPPGNRVVGIRAVMAVVTVQIREAVTKVIERQKETDVVPIENTKGHKSRDERCEFEDSPECFARVLAFQFLENGFGIFAKEAEEGVRERMFSFALLAVLVNGNPIDGLTVLVGAVGVPFMMLHVNAFVEDLAKADCHRLQDTEQTIEQRRTEIRIVNEIVRDAVDVPGNADRVDETQNEHDPKGDARKKIKHAEEISGV